MNAYYVVYIQKLEFEHFHKYNVANTLDTLIKIYNYTHNFTLVGFQIVFSIQMVQLDSCWGKQTPNEITYNTVGQNWLV